MVTVKNVSKKYKKVQALTDINFSISNHQIVGLVGPNGAGKSTLMRIISGINNPTSGEIILHAESEPSGIRISTVFDFNGLYPQLTAKENLYFFWKLKNPQIYNCEKLIDQVLKDMQLIDWKDSMTRVFSKGMLRKLTIARAIITHPDLLILDEPFDGLDIESHRFVIDFLKNWVSEGTRSILFASHNMSDVEDFCSKLIMINEGKIVMEKQILDLKEEGYKYLKIRLMQLRNVSDIKRALSEFHVEITAGSEKNEIHIYSQEAQIPKIVKKLCLEDFEIEEVVKECSNVEDAYIKTLGGIS